MIVEKTGRCDAVFFWWDLHMDDMGNINLSCAPWWHHEKSKDQPWRDHWMQAVYFPSRQITFQKGETAVLNCSHDEYSFWFDVLAENERFVLFIRFEGINIFYITRSISHETFCLLVCPLRIASFLKLFVKGVKVRFINLTIVI